MRIAFGASLAVLTFVGLTAEEVEKPRFEALSRTPQGWVELGIATPADAVYRVEASRTLNEWKEVATLMPGWGFAEAALMFVDPSAAGEEERYYRVQASTPTEANDWKNQIYYPEEPFLSEPTSFGEPETRWIKFAITQEEPSRVYFQNSAKYKFHYDFAKARLPQFSGMSPAEFDAVSLRTNGQQVVLGTVLFAPEPAMREAAIQFVGQDLYAAEQIAEWFQIVRAAIWPRENLQVWYIPTHEQSAAAEAHREYLEGRGVHLSTLSEWGSGENVYSAGWAIGRLKYFPQAEVAEAYASGALQPQDILLTDAVPAELPHLAGILTLSPATPNSHVAILARSHSIPFCYLGEGELRATAEMLKGEDVVFTAELGLEGAVVRLLNVSGIDPEVRAELVDLKAPDPIEIVAKESFGSYTASTDQLTPADIKYFGGKASNFGFLRRGIADNSPVAIAISFDLWDEFMDQMIGTKPLRTMIQERLAAHQYPPNMAALQADLSFIRDLIEDSTQFTGPQQAAIASALLEEFEPLRKIRFRSSTNVEDSDSFTGAGLYDSYSGCLADDQDGNNSGPSLCDSTESKERGVFRAIRKVYASFYNDNAVLERMRHKVDEEKVGMAVLVHYSSPDEFELANGVATLDIRQHSSFRSYKASLVTQKGAVSVTNPDNSALPEVVEVEQFSDTPYASTKQWSSLMQLGANVMEWDGDYVSFARYFEKVAEGFFEYYPQRQSFTLDFEYKKLAPGGVLSVKQVRQIPRVDPEARTTAYLLNSPGQWQVFQGEYGDVFANHRLKSLWAFTTRDTALSTNELATPIYTHIAGNILHDGGLLTREGDPADFPGAAHSVAETFYTEVATSDSWEEENGARLELVSHLHGSVRGEAVPVLTLDRMRLELRAKHDEPQWGLDYQDEPEFRSEESVLLAPVVNTNEHSIFVSREVASKSTSFRIQFYWPKPLHFAAGYTAPLQKWHETRIEGLTDEPIVLRGYYSQTYRPEHHNFAERFLFEPRLEEGISADIIEELESRNIRQILVYWGGGDNADKVWLIGRDNSVRAAP